TTHHVRQTWLARFWMVPYNTGWHLAHHVDIGIPFRKLPQLHEELVQSGWIVTDLEYPKYRALWRALAPGERRERGPAASGDTGHSGVRCPGGNACRPGARSARLHALPARR